MIKESPFAAEECEAKLDKLGDVLQVLVKHVDFAALAAEIDRAALGCANSPIYETISRSVASRRVK